MRVPVADAEMDKPAPNPREKPRLAVTLFLWVGCLLVRIRTADLLQQPRY